MQVTPHKRIDATKHGSTSYFVALAEWTVLDRVLNVHKRDKNCLWNMSEAV